MYIIPYFLLAITGLGVAWFLVGQWYYKKTGDRLFGFSRAFLFGYVFIWFMVMYFYRVEIENSSLLSIAIGITFVLLGICAALGN